MKNIEEKEYKFLKKLLEIHGSLSIEQALYRLSILHAFVAKK